MVDKNKTYFIKIIIIADCLYTAKKSSLKEFLSLLSKVVESLSILLMDCNERKLFQIIVNVKFKTWTPISKFSESACIWQTWVLLSLQFWKLFLISQTESNFIKLLSELIGKYQRENNHKENRNINMKSKKLIFFLTCQHILTGHYGTNRINKYM